MAAASVAALMFVFTSSSAAPPLKYATITSEMARRLSKAELEPLVTAALGHRWTLVDVEHLGFQFKATVRTRPRAEGRLCTASQLTMWFVPEPSLAPKGTAPGAIHVSRLPMEVGESMAAQVYRPGPPALATRGSWSKSDPCTNVDPALPFFIAKDAQAARAALALFEEVVALAKAEPSLLRLGCGGRDKQACLEELANLQPDTIETVADRCYTIYVLVEEQARCFSLGLRTEQLLAHGRSYRTLEIVVPKSAAGSGPSIERVHLSHSSVIV